MAFPEDIVTLPDGRQVNRQQAFREGWQWVQGDQPAPGTWIGGANNPNAGPIPNGSEVVTIPTVGTMTRQEAYERGWTQVGAPGPTSPAPSPTGGLTPGMWVGGPNNPNIGPVPQGDEMVTIPTVGTMTRQEAYERGWTQVGVPGSTAPVPTDGLTPGGMWSSASSSSMPSTAMPTSQQHISSVLTEAQSAPIDYTNGTWVGGPNRPGANAGVGASDMITLPTGEQTSRQDAYERGWDWTPSKPQSAASTASSPTTNSVFDTGDDAIRRMYGSVFDNEPMPTIPRGSQVSYEQFRNLLPSEQEYALGMAEEFGPERPEDFLEAMKRAAPDFQRSPVARSGVF